MSTASSPLTSMTRVLPFFLYLATFLTNFLCLCLPIPEFLIPYNASILLFPFSLYLRLLFPLPEHPLFFSISLSVCAVLCLFLLLILHATLRAPRNISLFLHRRRNTSSPSYTCNSRCFVRLPDATRGGAEFAIAGVGAFFCIKR